MFVRVCVCVCVLAFVCAVLMCVCVVSASFMGCLVHLCAIHTWRTCLCLHLTLPPGTVGDIESAAFIEAFRQFQWRLGRENFLVVHVSLVPVVSGTRYLR